MSSTMRLSTRKPHGYLGAAVAGHPCEATFAIVSPANQADRPTEAGS